MKRSADGSLGISIKGGTDHNLPILISKVCRNEEDDHVYIGDAIVKGKDAKTNGAHCSNDFSSNKGMAANSLSEMNRPRIKREKNKMELSVFKGIF